MINTIIQNQMGHLHIWKGKVHPVQVGKYNFHTDGKDSDEYHQVDTDIEFILNELTEEEKERVENGETVWTESISV